MITDPATLSAATLSIGQTVVAYQAFLPRLADVRKGDDPDTRADVVLGQFTAGGVSLLVGVLLSWMTGSPVPVMVSVMMALLIGFAYHYAMSRGETMA